MPFTNKEIDPISLNNRHVDNNFIVGIPTEIGLTSLKKLFDTFIYSDEKSVFHVEQSHRAFFVEFPETARKIVSSLFQRNWQTMDSFPYCELHLLIFPFAGYYDEMILLDYSNFRYNLLTLIPSELGNLPSLTDL